MSILVGATSACAGAAGQGPSADLGDTIEQSLRFRGGQALHHTFSRASSGGTATLSFWVKIAELDREHCFIINKNGNHRIVNVRNLNDWCFNSAGGSFTSYDSNTLARDPSAWYHVLVIQDSSVTSLYVNGSQVGSSTSGASGFWNSTGDNQIVIGAETDSGGGSTSVCYLAEYNLLDGTAIGVTDGVPDEFGRYNEDGVWVPKSVSSLTSDQYGADGFRLVFDSSAGIGDDSAPTGGNHASANDFTAVGFVTSGTGTDVDYLDTPTSNWCTLNPLDAAANNGIADGNLKCGTTTAANTTSIRSTQAVSSGKWYFEVQKITTGSINIQCGWAATSLAHTFNTGDTGVYNKAISGTTVMIAADFENNAIWTGVDGTWDNSATTAEIEAGTTTNATHTGVANYPLAPMFLDQAGSFSGEANFNFEQHAFIYTPPTGFSALQTNNLPEPTIKNGKEHFDVITWSGDNVSPRTITGLEFEPDFIWTKRRNSAASHLLYDSVRGFGETKHLHSDVTDAEGSANELNTNVAGFVSDNASNGFVLTQGTTNHDATNGSGNTYVSWCWKAGGTAVTNTDGTNSNTVNVSANQDAGFSIVTYTGEASNSPNTIGHGLNAVPEFIIVKRRDALENWAVYHASLGNDRSLELHDTTGQSASTSAFWNSTTPTSSVFSVGNGGATNEAGGTYVAYVWAPKEGFSKFGEYSGNGSTTDGPFVYLGFRPALVIIKCYNASTTNWVIADSTRSTANPLNEFLLANSSANESGAGSPIDFLSNGFKLVSDWGSVNGSSRDYVFMAWAENPFGGENAPPATAR